MKEPKGGGNSKDLDREFASKTTLHGIGQVIDNQRVVVKVAWLGILLTCLCVCSWQIVDRLQRYFEYNASTSLSVTYVGNLSFPAVTICNFNRYRKSALENETQSALKYAVSAADYDYDPYDKENVGEPNVIANFSYTEFTKRVGFILDNYTLLDCKWRGKKAGCQAYNFTHSFTSFGNCWTFNSGANGAEILSQSQPGSGNGLTVILDIQQSEYTETASGNLEAGLKVLVHHQETPPLAVDTAGLAITPGVHAFIGVRQIKHLNLGRPWGECNDTKLQYYSGYTIEGCTIECRAQAILKECKCRLVRHLGVAEECSPKSVDECAIPTLVKMKSGKIKECDCPVPCNYTEYSTTLSTATLPNNQVATELATWYYRSFNKSGHIDEANNTAYMRDNWIILDIYYDTMNYQVYKQSEEITTSALISDIGGQLGLFVGASFITVAEILFYLARKIRALMCTSKIHIVEPSHDDVIDFQGLASKNPKA